MARPLRIQRAGAVYHITALGNAQQSVFLELLGCVYDRHQRLCHALLPEVEEIKAKLKTDLSHGDVPKVQKLMPVKQMQFYRSQYSDRNIAMAEAYRSGHYNLAQMGEAFGVSCAIVSRAIKAWANVKFKA